MDLDALLASQEGRTLEFERDLSSPERILRTLVAFANTAGRVLLVGVEDRTRRVVGVPDPLDAEEKIANIVSDGIRPRLLPEIEFHPWRKTQILAIEVGRSPLIPHHVASLGRKAGVLVRVGSTNRAAGPERPAAGLPPAPEVNGVVAPFCRDFDLLGRVGSSESSE